MKRMKSIGLLLLGLALSAGAFAQYYYNDLITNRQTNQRYQDLIKQGVKRLTVRSYDNRSEELTDYRVVLEVNAAKRTLVTTTSNPETGNSRMEAVYNEKGWLIRTRDTSQNASNLTTYQYDNEGRLLTLDTKSLSDNISTTEVHKWTYNAAGQPEQMIRILNNSDTTVVKFVLDENGNPVEEHVSRKKLPTTIHYYYYDNANRLTDIVRYNQKAQRLLPDYIFEYNENNQVKKMTLVPAGSNAYEQWFYQYLPNGLRRMELVYNKQQQLMGKLEYTYE
jgi:hypothetical protein